ncbi:PGAP1-domain-containing protein [Hymenopellis radicata]|nr:PGAP1-domain-containing protein [Hymenopellis radicata]
MQRAYSSILLCLGSLAAVLCFYLSTLRVQQSLSPQGCRMSWMSPSYILQPDFNATWTPLAHRYSLWLYREVGWESNQIHGHQPVLFIPGNAGSSHQARSIASSAVRQVYTSPHQVSPEFRATSLKPIDVFAVEFNEDLSAFHGPTMEAQTQFTSDAVAYILSRYPPNTKIVIIGHSMGGIVATSLLPSDNIAAIITMSTPHSLPPARFDQRIDRIYDANNAALKNDPTPIMSLCGGATDMMIPSESCILEDGDSPYRRTVFSSALEGAWTGVGHREMVWCHQVRWRVARAALELQNADIDRATILDRWLRDGTRLPPSTALVPSPPVPPDQYRYLKEGERLVLDKPKGNAVYLLPLNLDASKFTLYVSKGSISSVSPHRPLPLEVSVFLCDQAAGVNNTACESAPLVPSVLRLIPSPIPGKTFPIAGEGSDESEGVVLFEVELSSIRRQGGWIAVQLDRAEGVGWVVGHTATESNERHSVSTTDLLFGGVTLKLPQNEDMHTVVELPHLLSHALLVYRLIPSATKSCIDTHLSPLLVHRSPRSELHYFALSDRHSNEIPLHTHSVGPFVDSGVPAHGMRLDFLSSGCTLESIHLEVAWVHTLGRWASRYFTSVVCWAVGIVSVMMFDFWGTSDGIPIITPTVTQSFTLFVQQRLLLLSTASFLIGFVPLPASIFLGNHGIPLLAPIGPLLLLISTGLVGCSCVLLSLLIWLFKLVLTRFHNQSRQEVVTASTLISMALILLAVWLFIPWQVAFLGCWTIQFMTCASTKAASENNQASTSGTRRNSDASSLNANNNCNLHILLFMTWLLPLAAPVLVVWVRTLLSAGPTTPFDGDHFVLNVAPFLVLVDFSSRTTGTAIFRRTRSEKYVSARWGFLVVGGVALIFGSRKAYMVFDAARLATATLVVLRIGPSYWRRWARSKP